MPRFADTSRSRSTTAPRSISETSDHPVLGRQRGFVRIMEDFRASVAGRATARIVRDQLCHRVTPKRSARWKHTRHAIHIPDARLDDRRLVGAGDRDRFALDRRITRLGSSPRGPDARRHSRQARTDFAQVMSGRRTPMLRKSRMRRASSRHGPVAAPRHFCLSLWDTHNDFLVGEYSADTRTRPRASGLR